jgi:hypothetical protein
MVYTPGSNLCLRTGAGSKVKALLSSAARCVMLQLIDLLLLFASFVARSPVSVHPSLAVAFA